MPRPRSLLLSWNRSLVARLTGVCLFASLVGAILAASVVYLQASAAVQTLLFAQLGAAAGLQHTALTRRVDELRRNLVFMASLPEVRAQAAALLADKTGGASPAYRALSYYLAYWVTGVPDSQEVCAVNADGAIVISTNPLHEGAVVAEQPYFSQGRFNTFVQTIYVSPLARQPVMTIATPLYDQNKLPIGVLVLNVDLGQLMHLVSEPAGLSAGGEIYLVDRSRRFMSAPGWARLSPVPPGGAHSAGIDGAMQGESGQGLYLNYAGRPVVGVYRWLDDFQLALVAEESAPEALAPAGALALTVLGLGLVLAAALTFAIYWLTRRLAQSVVLLTETVSRVAAGDLALRAPIGAPDEIGALAQAFNEMTAHLGGFIGNLEGQLAAGRPVEMPAGLERTSLGGEVDSLEREALQLLADLRRSLERREIFDLRCHAHRLKVVSVQLHADRLAAVCQKLEDENESADWETWVAKFSEAEAEWERLNPGRGAPRPTGEAPL